MSGLAPSTAYTYDVLVNGKSAFDGPKPSFRTFPARPARKTKLTVGFGGCARYNPPKEFMWDVIASREPDAFLFLGDNVYHDLPKDRTKQRVHYYRRQIRPEFKRLTAATSTYAIYDDHDLGKNDVAGGPDRYSPDWKLPSWEVFRENWNNPAYGGWRRTTRLLVHVFDRRHRCLHARRPLLPRVEKRRKYRDRHHAGPGAEKVAAGEAGRVDRDF